MLWMGTGLQENISAGYLHGSGTVSTLVGVHDRDMTGLPSHRPGSDEVSNLLLRY
jgi:hypothetical protein